MNYHLISSFLLRYTIDDTCVDWSLAEAQVASNLISGSVKVTAAGPKRELEESIDGGGKDKKKLTRKG